VDGVSALQYDVGFFKQLILRLPYSFLGGNLFTTKKAASGEVTRTLTPLRSVFLSLRISAEVASRVKPGISYTQFAFAPKPATTNG
jgi:hypothetical protein